ncbi:N-glycosylation protein [Schizosaccharomyces cryophilus OY26]|uniref:N-glycosylation protein n=1 Tax=Schizosaccharomyces cryophilus (strain OY26 / ATCC MYA-4695 / CBS 11777 / NBRC 106824 / NRRL Y48691) TaxID=653667 RepID=S9VYK8_SCHCR|nr:N-glycosylation protein [Schizosaccharomyces cryophilus OY26]EPY50890.1 N-glycosylation protein [Schizosaccharomyces cryophilus OY26]
MRRYLGSVVSNPRPAQALGINHPFIVFCFIATRTLSLAPAVYWCLKCLHLFFFGNGRAWLALTSALWTIVSGYLSFVLTTGFLLKWLIHYSIGPTIIRLLSLNVINFSFVSLSVNFITHGDNSLLLPAWIAISCFQTASYIVQDWITSPITRTVPFPSSSSANTSLSSRHNLDFLEITVFAVVPVGIASFFTMLMLLWQIYNDPIYFLGT